jgi:predicted nucleic acid-binding protein
VSVIVVSDTSPIRALVHVNQTELLSHIFGDVLIPPAVARELEHPAPGYNRVRVHDYPFMRVVEPSPGPTLDSLRAQLDPGESEAIALALEVGAAVLLIDEFKGRSVAAQMGVAVTGLLGLFRRAKEQGLITQVRPLLDELRSGLNFRVSDRLYSSFLSSVHE